MIQKTFIPIGMKYVYTKGYCTHLPTYNSSQCFIGGCNAFQHPHLYWNGIPFLLLFLSLQLSASFLACFFIPMSSLSQFHCFFVFYKSGNKSLKNLRKQLSLSKIKIFHIKPQKVILPRKSKKLWLLVGKESR